MRRITILLALTLVVALSMPAVAEVEEIAVGGSIIVRGEFQESGFGPGRTLVVNTTGGNSPTGEILPVITNSSTGFDDNIASQAWYSQRTRVNVDARLSGGVRASVELQAYDTWGDAGYDNIGTGSSNPVGNPAVELYQAYIDMNNIADYPVMLRIGRQELSYGREYLVGNNDAGNNFSGLSFDAIKVVYTEEDFQIDAWTAKLFEGNSPAGLGLLQDEDIDFSGVYGTYTGIENTVLDAYFILVRTPTSLTAADGGDADYLYTIGGRAAGTWDVMGTLPGPLDYNAEIAFQFGDATRLVTTLLLPAAPPLPAPVTSVADGDYEAWSLNLLAGCTFADVEWAPRLEVEYAFFSGDNDLLDGDVDSFTRLFSDVHYGELNLGGTFDAAATNLHIFRLGCSVVPVDELTVSADLYLFRLDEDDESGGGTTFGNAQNCNDDSVGYELDLVADYQYTEDLNLRVGWAHFFADDAIENAFGGDDDVDYLFVQATLDF